MPFKGVRQHDITREQNKEETNSQQAEVPLQNASAMSPKVRLKISYHLTDAGLYARKLFTKELAAVNICYSNCKLRNQYSTLKEFAPFTLIKQDVTKLVVKRLICFKTNGSTPETDMRENKILLHY